MQAGQVGKQAGGRSPEEGGRKAMQGKERRAKTKQKLEIDEESRKGNGENRKGGFPCRTRKTMLKSPLSPSPSRSPVAGAPSSLETRESVW